jgi:hypothetical protein
VSLYDEIKPIIAGQARHLATVAAGGLLTLGWLAPTKAAVFEEAAAGVLVWAVAAIWSAVQKDMAGDAKTAAIAKTMALMEVPPTGLTPPPEVVAQVEAAVDATKAAPVAAVAEKLAAAIDAPAVAQQAVITHNADQAAMALAQQQAPATPAAVVSALQTGSF